MGKTDPAQKERRRLDILAAAEQCFIERGFHQASMQDIARKAGVSMGLLYRYFENKDALIESFATIDQPAVIAAIERLGDAEDFRGELRMLTRVILHAATRPEYARLSAEVLAEACRNARLQALFIDNDHKVRQVLKAALDKQQRAGRIDAAVDTASFSELLLAMIDGFSVRTVLNPRTKRKAAQAALLQLLERALTHS